jgi:hypothetical protein
MTDKEHREYTRLVIFSIAGGIVSTWIWAVLFFDWSLVVLSVIACHGVCHISSNRPSKHLMAVVGWIPVLLLVVLPEEPHMVIRLVVTIGVGLQAGIFTLFIFSEINHRRRKQ